MQTSPNRCLSGSCKEYNGFAGHLAIISIRSRWSFPIYAQIDKKVTEAVQCSNGNEGSPNIDTVLLSGDIPIATDWSTSEVISSIGVKA